MPNDRLREALLQRGISVGELAAEVGVDRKTVERWITRDDRMPYRKYRYAVAARLGLDENYLWPEAITRDEVGAASESEILTVHPHRWMVPRDSWGRLFSRAQQEIGILVYVGMFLAEDVGVQQILADKAKDGVRVRILLGDPESPNVLQRGVDEGIGDAIVAKVRNAFVLYRDLRDKENVEIRTHGTVLYNSIYRVDDELFVNPHVYGVNASHAPLFHLRKISLGEMVKTYMESFERIWENAKPLTKE
jgi:hypothetical protein